MEEKVFIEKHWILWLHVEMACESLVTFVTFGPLDQTAYHLGAEHSI